MRRMTILVAIVALMVTLFATAAYAAATAVYGTNGDDYVINESSGWVDDRIYGLAGDDYINAVVTWSTTNSDTDKLFGGKGDDILGADDGDGADLLKGGPGYDRCWGTQGDRFASCEEISLEELY
jgi:RTX calcium-binding nonapeptide repeat (4 copies)